MVVVLMVVLVVTLAVVFGFVVDFRVVTAGLFVVALESVSRIQR